MITFISKGVMYSGPSAVSLAQRAAPVGREHWIKKWGNGTTNEKGHKRRGRMRTLAVMARALNAAARARGGRRAVSTPTVGSVAGIGIV